jgi:hypothetical protein
MEKFRDRRILNKNSAPCWLSWIYLSFKVYYLTTLSFTKIRLYSVSDRRTDDYGALLKW